MVLTFVGSEQDGLLFYFLILKVAFGFTNLSVKKHIVFLAAMSNLSESGYEELCTHAHNYTHGNIHT